MSPETLIELLLRNNHTFITGVPDSVFKDFINQANQDNRFHHVITNNEGESCALAAGYHLATGNVAAVYLQNSGLGNAINPLTSLLDENIYSIPTLLLIGWRAVPGEQDEPQHKRMGAITPDLLTLLDIPHAIFDPDKEVMAAIFREAQQHFRARKSPYAILFPRESITANTSTAQKVIIPDGEVLREELLALLVRNSKEDDVFITTTGKTSRELYEIRERVDQDHARDFLTVGSMGCAATIALGIAMQRSDRRVILVDGDGACLMRMEALATIGHIRPANLLHILVDNNAYESTGSQKTLSSNINIPDIAKACGYPLSLAVDTLADFKQAFSQFTHGPMMLCVKSFSYSRSDLGRPKTTPLENKIAFMEQLGVTLCKP